MLLGTATVFVHVQSKLTRGRLAATLLYAPVFLGEGESDS